MEMDASLMKEFMLQHWTMAMPYAALIGIVSGGLLGVGHFMTLKWNTSLYLDGGIGKAISLHFLRFSVLIAVMILLAKIGAVALLSGLAGLLISRVVIMQRERKAE